MNFTTILLLLVVSVGTVCSQMIHSIDKVHRMVELKGILALQLKKYLPRVDNVDTIKKLDKLVRKLKDESEEVTKEELEKTMSHPVRMFRFFASFEEYRKEIDSLVKDKSIANIKKTLEELPEEPEFVYTVKAIARLQQMYGDAADFTRPQGGNHKDVFTGHELFKIGKVCALQGDGHCSLNSFKRAREIHEEANNFPAAMLAYEYFTYALAEQGNSGHALNYTYDLLKYYEKDEVATRRLNNNIKILINLLGGEEKAKRKVTITEPYKNPISRRTYLNYKELCNGEPIKTVFTETQPLQCHMYTNNNHPLLIISPAKKEDLDTKTGLSFFHHVLTDKEIKILKAAAAKTLEDSSIASNRTLETEHEKRSSKTGWVKDSEDSMIKAISNRVVATVGLSLSSAEDFQVLSYGIGGFYSPHYDWGVGEDPFPDFGGNRIATWIFYLNDVARGGATVFPNLGVTVWPEKGGAAFWRNLYYNGEGDPRTLHAACPVLEGYKWVSNKWFHTGGNEFKWRCKTDPSL